MFKAKLKIIEFNKKGYTDAVGKAIEIQVRQAAREWLRAVILKVPVYTGMARGSLLPLGRYLKVAVPISPVVKPRRGQGIAAGELLQHFEFKSIPSKYIWKFLYSTEVFHYLINELNEGLGSPPLIHPTPWHSFEAGKIAWREYLHRELKQKIPKISKYIQRTKID